MGPLTNAEADALTAFGYAEWTGVSTATLSAAVAGDFASVGLPDITGSNAGLVVGTFNGGGLHVLYDDDGSIIRDFFGAPPGVLGIASPEFFATGTPNLLESWAVVNGAAVDLSDVGGQEFAGVFTHEFGHSINLAHTQTNGAIVFFGDQTRPTNCGAPYSGFPSFADVDTMYPFLCTFPGCTGRFQATVDVLDDVASVSNVYPAVGWPGDFASITGTIFLGNGVDQITGVNVIARNVADPFHNSISALSGDFTQGFLGPDGTYTFNGLTPGAEYVVYVDQIVAGGFSTSPVILPGDEEYFNGANESNNALIDDRCESVRVSGSAGTISDASIIFNNNIPLGDDDAALIDLPFSFPFCGRLYNSVWVGSNGFVTFEFPDVDFSESVPDLLNGPPRIAPLWRDLNPAAGGIVTAGGLGGNFVINYVDVPEFPAVGSNSFALTLRPDGTFNFAYDGLTAENGLAGRSQGLGFAADPGEIDLSKAPQPISGAPGGAVYELFDRGRNDLAGRNLDWAACENFVADLEPATSGVLYGSTGFASGGLLLTIDRRTGAGSFVGATGLNGVPGLAVNSSGELWGTERNSGDLYRIDPVSGRAFFVSSPGLLFLDSIAFDENDVLYSVAFDPPSYTLVAIDPASGAVTPIGPTGDAMTGLAFDPTTGQLYGSVGGFEPNVADGIYRIDTATGQSTLVGTTGLGGPTPDLHFDLSGQMYGVKGGGVGVNNLITIDKNTGAGTIVGPVGFSAVSGLGAFTPSAIATVDAGVLLGSTGFADGGRLLNIDLRSAEGSLIGATGLNAVPGLAVNSQGEIYGTDGTNGDLYRIDADTGQSTLIGSTGVPFNDAIAFDRDDVLYGIGFDPPFFNLRIIDTRTGATTVVGPTGDVFVGMAFDPSVGPEDDCDCPPVPPVQEQIVNGDFEMGNLTGWTIQVVGSGSWVINNGLLDPSGPGSPLPPISGSFDAITIQSGNGVRLLSEAFRVPTGLTSAVLSWSDRIRNHANVFSDPNQEYRVNLHDAGGNVIQEIFSTNPGDAPMQVGPNPRFFDLTALLQTLEGQLVSLSFEQEDSLFFFNVTIDDVSFVTERVPGESDCECDLYASVGGFLPLNPDAIFRIDKLSGKATLVGTTGFGGPTPDLAFDLAGNLCGTKGGGSQDNDLIAIDKETGQGSAVGSIGFRSVSGLSMFGPLVETIDDLRVLVNAITMEANFKSGLLAKLTEAEEALARGKNKVATNKLKDFTNQVMGRGGTAQSEAEVNLLVGAANSLIRSIR
jgi:hypothetical protein